MTQLLDESRSVTVEMSGNKQVLDAACYQVDVSEGVSFQILTERAETDEITQSIVRGEFSLPLSFDLLPRLAPPGGRVLDLGGHIGTFSLFAASLGYRTVAVEASPRNAALLNESVKQNGFNDRLTVFSQAISNRDETISFIQAGPYGLVSSPEHNDPTVEVQATTVEVLLARAGWDSVDFIKMDIEGPEVKAIEGMSNLLTGEDAPVILYESNGHTLHYFGETPGSLMKALEAFGYRCYLVHGKQLVPVHSGELQPLCTVDYLAVRQPLKAPEGWTVRQPFTVEEQQELILGMCTNPNKYERAYIARALAQARTSELLDDRIINELNKLLLDPNAEVKSAISWYQARAR